MNIVFGIFIMLHGMVHLLYFGHTARYFELKPGLTWPTGSWIFSGLLSDRTARFLVSLLLVLAGLGFIASGIGILISQGWFRPLIIMITTLSMLIFIFFWNGKLQSLDGQGVVGIFIDLLILVLVGIFRWPKVSF